MIPHPDFVGKSGGGTFSDALHELDHRTGQLLDAIDQTGIVWSPLSRQSAGRDGSRTPSEIRQDFPELWLGLARVHI